MATYTHNVNAYVDKLTRSRVESCAMRRRLLGQNGDLSATVREALEFGLDVLEGRLDELEGRHASVSTGEADQPEAVRPGE